jgi:hypothetical protein
MDREIYEQQLAHFGFDSWKQKAEEGAEMWDIPWVNNDSDDSDSEDEES